MIKAQLFEAENGEELTTLINDYFEEYPYLELIDFKYQTNFVFSDEEELENYSCLLFLRLDEYK